MSDWCAHPEAFFDEDSVGMASMTVFLTLEKTPPKTL